MRLRTRLALGAAATLSVLGLYCQGPEPMTDRGRCQEDMPCWDCETMGNLICGPAADPGETVP